MGIRLNLFCNHLHIFHVVSVHAVLDLRNVALFERALVAGNQILLRGVDT